MFTDHSTRHLPQPDPVAQAQSDRLLSRIRQEIDQAGGAIPFDRFMELALYAPALGYYSAGSQKLGPQGDFVTAPEISALFSHTLAGQCADILRHSNRGNVLEVGAGSGVMAADILDELDRLHQLPERYYILEVSGELRERQRQTLAERAPVVRERVRWLDCLPERFTGVVLANEVLDAMPVQRFRIGQAGGAECCVGWNGERLVWAEGPPSLRLQERVATLRGTYGLAQGYTSEVNLRAEDWVRGIGQRLEQGVILIIDYGFPQREYYHSERRAGTLMCHYRHRAHADPFMAVGLQDITAHLDFTALAEAALEGGLTVEGFTNQANFLLANGLVERAATARDAVQQLQMANAIKRLTLPSEMGELFKVMALGRGIHAPLKGFLLRDDRGRL